MSETPVNSDSILLTIKKALGIDASFTEFDLDIMMHINSVFMTLTQLGVGPEVGMRVKDETDNWISIIPESKNLDAIKSYVLLKVRLLFDPPTNGFTITAFEKQATEFEWRLNIQAEN